MSAKSPLKISYSKKRKSAETTKNNACKISAKKLLTLTKESPLKLRKIMPAKSPLKMSYSNKRKSAETTKNNVRQICAKNLQTLNQNVH